VPCRLDGGERLVVLEPSVSHTMLSGAQALLVDRARVVVSGCGCLAMCVLRGGEFVTCPGSCELGVLDMICGAQESVRRRRVATRQVRGRTLRLCVRLSGALTSIVAGGVRCGRRSTAVRVVALLLWLPLEVLLVLLHALEVTLSVRETLMRSGNLAVLLGRLRLATKLVKLFLPARHGTLSVLARKAGRLEAMLSICEMQECRQGELAQECQESSIEHEEEGDGPRPSRARRSSSSICLRCW